MYAVFIDEAGQPGGFDREKNCLTKGSSHFFTLSSFIVEADKILDIETKLKNIKMKYNLKPFHEVKWSTSYSKLGLNLEQYKNMKTDVMTMVSEYKHSTIGVVMDKENCYKNKTEIKKHSDLYAFALNLLMERVHMEISDRTGKANKIPTLMFTDSRKNDSNNKLDKELQIAYLKTKRRGTHYIKFPNFCESLIFMDSNYSAGIQCADFCAGAIHKKFETNDDTFFSILRPAIRHNKFNNIYGHGIKIYK